MVSKKLLSAAIAAAFLSVPAFAAIDLGDKDTVIKYAKDALTDKVGNNHYLVEDGVGTVLDVDVELGWGVAQDDQIWVRFDLTNAVFATAVGPGDLTISNGANLITKASGGAAEGTSVVFAVTVDTADAEQDDVISLALADLGISATAGVGITYSLYESASGAAAGGTTGRLATVTLANAITTGTALTTSYNANNVTADVETGFLEFTTGTDVSLGNVEVTADADFLAANDSLAVDLTDLIVEADSVVTPAGNFTFGAENDGAVFYFDLNSNAAYDAGEEVLDADDAVQDFALDDVNGIDLRVAVTGDEADEYKIPVAAYTADVDFEPAADVAFGATSATGALGTISRNGTVVQVPYLTTYEAYNQRLVIVNRSGTAAEYALDFTEEAGVTTTKKAAATGTLAPNETKIIKATDLVTITGSTRTAATLTVVASTSDIDVATTTVNLADQATDTVVLQ
jgi:hypothetical protein